MNSSVRNMLQEHWSKVLVNHYSLAIDISRSPVVDMFSEAIRCRISSILTLSSYSKIVFCGIAANGIRAREMMVNRCFILMLYAEMFVNCREYTQLLF